jgi:hypothetical protein
MFRAKSLEFAGSGCRVEELTPSKGIMNQSLGFIVYCLVFRV